MAKITHLSKSKVSKSYEPHDKKVQTSKKVHSEALSPLVKQTLERDISVHSSVIIELYHVAVELIERLQRKEFKGNTLTLKIKFHDFSQITRSITQSQELYTLDRILPLAKELLKSVEYEQHPIRLIGLSVSNPKEEADEQHGVWEQLSFEFSDWE